MKDKIHYLWMIIAALFIIVGGIIGSKAVEGDPVKYYWQSTGSSWDDTLYLYRVNTETGKCWKYAIWSGGLEIYSMEFDGRVSATSYSEEKERVEYEHIPIEELSAR